ncbi:MAG: MoaD/ThiS family protein [Bacteroidetes bacterium]|nr:MoaD/ThiS family protein [Bacteroidota bacterium]
MSVRVLFFGFLAERAGAPEKRYEAVTDTNALEAMVAGEIEGLQEYSYIVSVNRQAIRGNTPLNDGDEVAFLPPFAGG